MPNTRKAPPKNTLFTVGYEGLDVPAFTQLLARHGVQTVVDIRELPLSRKRGFSKQSLRHELQYAGFGYTHIGALGCPKTVRNGYRADKDWARYTAGFMQHLGRQQAAIDSVAELAQKTSCALLCFEADFNYCHRSMVAEAVGKHGDLQVIHIAASDDDDSNLRLF